MPRQVRPASRTAVVNRDETRRPRTVTVGVRCPGPSVGGPHGYRRVVPAETSASVAVGLSVGPSEPFEVTGAVIDPLAACLSAVGGVPAAPVGTLPGLPTLPAVLALADAAGDGGPSGVLRVAVAGRSGAAVVHGDTRLEAVRPVRVGDCLVFTSTVESVRSMGGATVLAVATSVVALGPPGGGSEPVASVRSTFVVTAPAPVVRR